MQLKGIIMKNMLIEPKYQGIVFDLDGTLINSLADLIDSLNIVMEYYDLPPKTYEEGKKLIGRGLRNLVKRALPRKLSQIDSIVDEALQIMLDEYSKRRTNKTRPYENVQFLLDYMNNHEIPIGVCSNKEDLLANQIVRELFPNTAFELVLGQKEDEYRKPDPTPALKVAGALGLSPDQCLYLGDSVIDYQAAKNAGMLPVLCTWGYTKADQLMQFEDAIWIKNPIRAIDALKYGRDMYRIFQKNEKKVIRGEE